MVRFNSETSLESLSLRVEPPFYKTVATPERHDYLANNKTGKTTKMLETTP